MSRLFGMVLLVSLVILIFVALLGRAIDYRIQDHVLITRDGQTLDCVRVVKGHGNVHYDDCVVVP